MSFVSKLRKAYERLSVPLSAHKWHSELERLLEDFIQLRSDDDSGWQHLRQAFAQLDKHLLAAPESADNESSDRNTDNTASGSISCETILLALERELKSISGDSGFFRGGITFSSILPLRAVPARMICLIGLNDGDFPRSQRPSAYDLIAARPRAGDRNVRDEDRYLFLETLLAARKTLVLSYLGRDPKDNHLRPPAVVVSELIDYIEEHFVPAPESDCASMREFLLCDHPPQPFSSHYFNKVDGEGGLEAAALFSYDTLQAEIATEVNNPAKAAPDFLGTPLADVACERVELADLISFFNNPAKFFLQKRLKVSPGIKDLDQFADSEPFKLDGLATYKFNDELVTHFMAGDERAAANSQDEISELEKRFAASGLLPPLAPGRAVFADKIKGAQALAAQLKPFCTTRVPVLQKEVMLSFSGGDVKIVVTLANLFQDQEGILRQILFRPAADLKKRDLVKNAIMNLGLEILSASVTDSQDGTDLPFNPLETRFHTLKDKATLILPRRAADAAQIDFAELLDIYFTGLRQPLTFLPEFSLLWYETWLKESGKHGDAAAQISARDKVRNELTNERNFAAQDEAYRFVFADRFGDEDFWFEFETLARKLGPVFMPAAGN
jgi:exodeoxyribonuclease V gamma subunit